MSFHHLFICNKEVNDYRPVNATYAPTIIDAPVPGYIPKKQRKLGNNLKVPKVQKVLSEDARINGNGAIGWALELHSAGFSLNGKFEAFDLRVGPRNIVKCAATKRVLLKKATTKRKKKDFKRIRKIIKNDILKVQSETDLPSDVQYLLDLLKSYEAGYEIMLANHPGFMKEDDKIGLFDKLFSELEFLKVTDPLKYQNIIGALPYGNKIWIDFAYCNKYVNAVYTFRNGMRKYLDSSEGAVHLYRNCFQHLMDHAAVRRGAVTVVFFVRKQMEHMLGTILPGVIARMMNVMYNESALSGVF